MTDRFKESNCAAIDCGKIAVQHFDCGALIGIAVEYKGERRTVRVPNPFAAEIDAEWRKAHPKDAA